MREIFTLLKYDDAAERMNNRRGSRARAEVSTHARYRNESTGPYEEVTEYWSLDETAKSTNNPRRESEPQATGDNCARKSESNARRVNISTPVRNIPGLELHGAGCEQTKKISSL